MISGNDLQPFLLQLNGRLDDGARLHLGDLRIRDAEAHAAMAEHRIELVQLLDAREQLPLRFELALVAVGHFELGDLHHQVFALRQELVQRRIDRADGDRLSLHRLEHAVEVGALHRQQLEHRLLPIGHVVGQDHALHDRQAILAEEHVLGAAQPDAARAERVRQLGLIGKIRVRADAQAADLVGPLQQLAEALVDVRLLRIELAVDDLENLARLRRHLPELDLPLRGRRTTRTRLP